jgi:hypothetical protein
MGVPIIARYRFTPSAANHTYSIAAWVNSTTGTPVVGAAPGNSSGVPAYLRFTKV